MGVESWGLEIDAFPAVSECAGQSALCHPRDPRNHYRFRCRETHCCHRTTPAWLPRARTLLRRGPKLIGLWRHSCHVPAPLIRQHLRRLVIRFDADAHGCDLKPGKQSHLAAEHKPCTSTLASYTSAMPFTVATWNVNSLRARLPLVLRYLDEQAPEVLCLQETRLHRAQVDRQEFRERGYHVQAGGERGYAGVAILSKRPFQEVIHGFGADNEHHDRRLLCQLDTCWIDTVYVPTRRAIGKSEFLDRLQQDYCARFEANRDSLLLCGDFNVCFDTRDLASLRMISEAESFGQRPEDLALRRMLGFGLQDCLRKHHPDTKLFSWFPQTPWALRRNYGMRLDYMFATHPLYERCCGADHDASPCHWPRPSDHLPVVARFER